MTLNIGLSTVYCSKYFDGENVAAARNISNLENTLQNLILIASFRNIICLL